VTTVALIGNPNAGKTTVFNSLTGGHQHVGNWPGVTVERKTGKYLQENDNYKVVDLPGVYSLNPAGTSPDEAIAQKYLGEHRPDVIVNVIDASSISRGLFLTTELLELAIPVVVALNMTDVAEHHGLKIDAQKLANSINCPVIELVASKNQGIRDLKAAIKLARQTTMSNSLGSQLGSETERYVHIDKIVHASVKHVPISKTLTEKIDQLVLNKYLAFPIFLGVLYAMFMFSINFGSAFIDLFDGLAGVIFVDLPELAMITLGFPSWSIAFVADAVGGGMQLVATFIPVIGCLFLALSFLEDSGYMARVAFLVDRLMSKLGLPGKSFVPLIVGFGCNVPAIMATRTLENESDRILTTIMAPYMSCGARLSVYALFAAAFFPVGGQNIVFALYLIGITVAVLSAFIVRKHLVQQQSSNFLIELPAYHLPTIKGLSILTWQRLKGFVLRAGKAIVAVVIVLNLINSWGTDGSFGNQDSETSMLSEIGRTITPVFGPMGIREENWPATVGIFTGIFAKEVVVGTLDSLYAPKSQETKPNLKDKITGALKTVPNNLQNLTTQLADPLGIKIEETTSFSETASAQGVEVKTLNRMYTLFDGKLGAFSYLLFILLYMPCVATIGVIFKEIGRFWAMFSTVWSITIAYCCAVFCYQIGNIMETPYYSITSSAITLAVTGTIFSYLIWVGKRRKRKLIPVTQIK